MSASLLERLGLHRKELRAWAMYDWANSAFASTIMAGFLPTYYFQVAAKDLPENIRTSYWGYTAAAALAVTAVCAPFLGAVADYLGAKKRFLLLFMTFGIVGSALLFFTGEGDWRFASAMFIIGNIGFAGGNVFYDSLLPHIASEEEVDRVSTAGYAIGYIGGGVLLLINLAWFLKPDWFGFADAGVAVRASFISVAVWWLVFAIPLLRYVDEPKGNGLANENIWTVGFVRLWATFKELRQYKQVLMFIVAFWFYSDGIGTIIKMATIYGGEIGIGTTHLIGALALVQFLGIPATFAFGFIAGRLGPIKGIMIGLGVYVLICVLGYFMTAAWHFWVLATLVALVQGGVQALSRSLYATMIPQSKSSEFFSFVSVSAKFAGIFGPAIFGVIAQFTGGSRNSILFLVSFFAIGAFLLLKVDPEEGRRVAKNADRLAQKL